MKARIVDKTDFLFADLAQLNIPANIPGLGLDHFILTPPSLYHEYGWRVFSEVIELFSELLKVLLQLPLFSF